MRLFADQKIKEFCKRHPAARAAAMHWERAIRVKNFANYNHLRQFFRSADYVSPYTIFNLGGNQYRIIAVINFAQSTVRILWVFTHPEYDKWSRQYLKGKVKR